MKFLRLFLPTTLLFIFATVFPFRFAAGLETWGAGVSSLSGDDFLAQPPVAESLSKTPLLTLLYAADTKGELHPCPT